ncbi:molybdopterin-containing oxidoreductase family protein [Thermodesulforhabdus norvegica]|uniref:Anaerobic selenocysteine-containing dehydrogenase n=1 Tax=Thermodesulforhabdus norvegica TaxID=39841 RepID=A0A1I4RKK8_9BACT|nr:molybdopterin-dependent oxidoreductase [Thermodesulforhabdus norvegica]SFM52734.1 Anaerobic selenocysteine-containing dehydrogenase [Thermodesulforhabdus norvegica]
MKVGRRAFIGFVAGGIAGTLLSPIPWKLADDIAIWTQNWSWRPSPKRGHRAGVGTLCTMCGSACSVEVDLVDRQRAIYVRGSSLSPLNKGGLCALGASAVQFLYSPYRVRQPLRQTKKRGDRTGFKAISWKEAIGELGARLKKLYEEGKGHQVACLSGQRYTSLYELWSLFCGALGSSNLFAMPRETDGHSAVSQALFGHEGPFAFRLYRATGILNFGAEWADGWSSCAPMGRMYEEWVREVPGKGRTEIVHVSSRLSMSASKSNEWIPVKPGTEAALALGIAHVLIRENRVFRGVEEYEGYLNWIDSSGETRQGFRDYVLKEYSPDRVSGITGAPAAKIEELARWVASQPSPLVVWGSEGFGGPGFFHHEMAYVALNMLLGNFEDKGLCTFTPVTNSLKAAQGEESLAEERLDVAAGTSGLVGARSNSIYAFFEALAQGKGYPVDVLLVCEANPIYSMADAALVRDAWSKAGFTVAMTGFMDETALEADLILPTPVMLERWDDVTAVPGLPFALYGLSAPVINPLYDVKHPGDVVLQLAAMVGDETRRALPWKKYEDVLKAQVKFIADQGIGAVSDDKTDFSHLEPDKTPKKNYRNAADLLKKLKKGSLWYAPVASTSQFVKTETGKPRFFASVLENAGMGLEKPELLMPHFLALQSSGSEQEYPLLLVAYGVSYISSGYFPNSPLMMKNLWDFELKGNDGFIGVNPATAKELGLAEGMSVVVETPQGKARARVHLSPAVSPGLIAAVKGLGHWAYDEYLADKGLRVTELTEVQLDPVTALGVERVTRAKLVRA